MADVKTQCTHNSMTMKVESLVVRHNPYSPWGLYQWRSELIGVNKIKSYEMFIKVYNT